MAISEEIENGREGREGERFPARVKSSSERRFSLKSLIDIPRRSIGTIQERLNFGRRKPKKRMSTSDTALFKRHVKKPDVLYLSNISIRSARSAIGKFANNSNKIASTKWSRKLFGSEKAVMDEQSKVESAGKFIIHPFSNFRLGWDIISSLIILANVVVIPMDIAFSGDTEDIRNLIFKLMSDVWFMTDIVLNFRTGIQLSSSDQTTFELNPKRITKRYLKTWFLLDILASFPLDFIFRFFIDRKKGKVMSFLRVGKVLALVKLARLPRLVRGLHHWEEIFNLQYDFAVSMLRFTYLISFIFFTCHINGCLQYMVPMFYGFPNDTWVKMRGLDHPNVTWWEAYSWSLFKATSQMLCLGYSQIIPVGIIDLWMTLLSQVGGAIIFALFIGNAINLMQEMDATKNAYKMKINQIQEYLGFRRIPLKLRRQVLDYCEVRFMGKLFNETQILRELSPVLRREVIWHNTASLIQSVPLFEDVSDDFVYYLGERLHYVVFMQNDYIVKDGTRAMHMFFISRGEVEIKSPIFANELSDGGHFGEACLFSGELRRSANVIALTTVHMFTLHRNDYVQVLRKLPEDAEKIAIRSKKIREISSRYDFIKRHSSVVNL